MLFIVADIYNDVNMIVGLADTEGRGG